MAATAHVSAAVPLPLSGAVEAFVPSDFSSGVRRIGGLPVILMLVDRAASADALTHALGLLVSVVRFSSSNTRQMEELHGYEVLGCVVKSSLDLDSETNINQSQVSPKAESSIP